MGKTDTFPVLFTQNKAYKQGGGGVARLTVNGAGYADYHVILPPL